jgi:hypothetical protein
MAQHIPWHQGGLQHVRINLVGISQTLINSSKVKNHNKNKVKFIDLPRF